MRTDSRARYAAVPRPWGVTTGFTLAVWLITSLIFAAPTEAHPAFGCIVTIRNVEGSTLPFLIGDDPDQTGIYSLMHFGYQSGDCIRVSSEGIVRGATGVVEFGWVLGWHPNDGNLYTGPGYCNDRYYTDPELFIVWQPQGGGYHCRDLQSVPTDANGADYGGSVYWSGSNYDFDSYFRGNYQTAVSVNFKYGSAVTNGERHNLNIDSAYSHFQNLQKRILSNPGAWRDFTFSFCYVDNDPDFDWYGISANETKVYAHTGASC